METSRFYYLVAVGVIAIILLVFFHRDPFEGGGDKPKAPTEKQELARRTADAAREEMERSQIRLSEYSALRKGMTYDEVAQIHGKGREVGRKVEYYRELVTYRWPDQGYPASWMELTFADGKLSEMKQKGLS